MNNVSGNTYGATTANKQTQKEGCNINGKLKEKDVIFTGQVSARDGIKFTNVTANAVKCSMGAIKAINSTLNDVSGRDGIKLKSVTALGEIKSSMGKVDAEDSKLGNVEGRDGVKIQRTLADSVKSSMGSIQAKESSLGRVEGRDGVKLTDTVARVVSVSMGGLEWSNSKLSENASNSLVCRENIELNLVKCDGTTSSSMGTIKATGSLLNDVKARDGVKLFYTIARDVSVSMGELHIENTNPETAKFQQLAAREKITLENISVENSVKSSMGIVKANNCILNSVEARDGMTLLNCSANSCNVTMGDLSISAEQKRSFKTLLARNNIDLKNITAEKVESKCGKVSAEYCTLKEIESTGELSLVRSTCGSAKLSVEEGNKGILTLSDSTIEGNLIVEVIKGGTNMFGSILSPSNGSTCSIISGRTFQIVTSSIDAFDCTYMQNGSTGTVNGIPYKFEGGKFVSLARVEKKSKVSEEIEIEINGNGLLNGNIVFKGCTGKVTITANAKVGGIKNLQ